MSVEGVSWGLKLDCWESKQPQNTPEKKSSRDLEMLFLRHKGQSCTCRTAFISRCLWGQVGPGKKDLRHMGIFELYPETITLWAFSSEILLSTDALAPNTPQGINGSQRILVLAAFVGIWTKSRGMVEMMLCFEFSTWNLVWIQKLMFVQAFGFEYWNFTVPWWLGPGVSFLYFQ